MAEWIGELFTSDRGWSLLEALTEIEHRMAGTEGERRAAEATRDALAAAGARDVRLEPFEIQGWERNETSVSSDTREYPAIALPRSPSGAVTGPLVDVGYGQPADFDRDLEGAIVVARTDVPSWQDRFIHRREKYERAIDAGAAAFVFHNHVPGQLAPTGSVGRPASPIGAIPAVGIAKEAGARLVRQHAGERVTVAVDADCYETTSCNVHGHVGPDTETELLLTSHVDAHDIAEGALDNAAGTATVIEVVAALASHDLETGVHVICFGAEEVGLRGSTHVSESRHLGDVKAVVNNDGVASGRTLSVRTNGFDGLTEAVETVADRTGHPIVASPRMSPHSDHWPFVRQGIPGLHVMSQTDDRGRGWGHTAADTLDKLELRTLREQAYLVTELVRHVAEGSVAVDHRRPEAIADQLHEEDLAAGLRVAGSWPY